MENAHLQGLHCLWLIKAAQDFELLLFCSLFSDTVDGAKTSAVIYSLMLTCRASRVEH
ncbi:hypothetical protein [Rhizobium mesoamericanum]|uniref:hypothetical protein n=1 Tax=Rhizobium mesoamericanum TaxID=1079800 RepID=UPI0012DC75C2|nr:hypothetical protein [Rhizobium mesoamericanum]